MSQSLTKIYVHIIFHTKKNGSSIRIMESDKLYAYISGIIKRNECVPLLINGVSDHVHILCILSKNISIAKLIQIIKQNSSRWLRSQDNYYHNFEWQGGYAAFSVSPSALNKTKEYIRNQRIHHKKRSFQQEYVLFLQKYGIDYDEKYLWND